MSVSGWGRGERTKRFFPESGVADLFGKGAIDRPVGLLPFISGLAT